MKTIKSRNMGRMEGEKNGNAVNNGCPIAHYYFGGINLISYLIDTASNKEEECKQVAATNNWFLSSFIAFTAA